ncbi:unnamed protein product [Rhizophagus irregularis]|nr:unnamed protein product [Rhizophagus irregularis]
MSLYKTACDAEEKAIETNRVETLRWCFYAREFKSMYKYFMASNEVGEKKAKRSVRILFQNLLVLRFKHYGSLHRKAQFGDPEEQNEDNSFNLDTIQVSGNHRGGFLGTMQLNKTSGHQAGNTWIFKFYVGRLEYKFETSVAEYHLDFQIRSLAR